MCIDYSCQGSRAEDGLPLEKPDIYRAIDEDIVSAYGDIGITRITPMIIIKDYLIKKLLKK